MTTAMTATGKSSAGVELECNGRGLKVSYTADDVRTSLAVRRQVERSLVQ